MQIRYQDEQDQWHDWIDRARNSMELHDRDRANQIARQLVERGALEARVVLGSSILVQWVLDRDGEIKNLCDPTP